MNKMEHRIPLFENIECIHRRRHFAKQDCDCVWDSDSGWCKGVWQHCYLRFKRSDRRIEKKFLIFTFAFACRMPQVHNKLSCSIVSLILKLSSHFPKKISKLFRFAHKSRTIRQSDLIYWPRNVRTKEGQTWHSHRISNVRLSLWVLPFHHPLHKKNEI